MRTASDVERVEASWDALQGTIAAIPEERWLEPGATGDWSVKDVITHIAYWEDDLADACERRLTGRPDPPPLGDIQAHNDRVYAERRDWSLSDVLSDAARAHARVLAALRQAPDVHPGRIAAETWEHYAEHAEWLQEWREREGS